MKNTRRKRRGDGLLLEKLVGVDRKRWMDGGGIVRMRSGGLPVLL